MWHTSVISILFLWVMTIKEYKKRAVAAGYTEYPWIESGDEVSLADFVDYSELSPKLRLYLCEHILCKCFYGTRMAWYNNVLWFIEGFTNANNEDVLRPGLTIAIKDATKLIVSGDIFSQQIIGTCFMFGIVEYYTKYNLGFRPFEYDFFDKNKKNYIKQHRKNSDKSEISIGTAIHFLQQLELPISKSLKKIDKFTSARLKRRKIEQGRWIEHTIAKRISLARNPMLHGELHMFPDMGYYLGMIYILFHLHQRK